MLSWAPYVPQEERKAMKLGVPLGRIWEMAANLPTALLEGSIRVGPVHREQRVPHRNRERMAVLTRHRALAADSPP
jgi:hypothetical protein